MSAPAAVMDRYYIRWSSHKHGEWNEQAICDSEASAWDTINEWRDDFTLEEVVHVDLSAGTCADLTEYFTRPARATLACRADYERSERLIEAA